LQLARCHRADALVDRIPQLIRDESSTLLDCGPQLELILPLVPTLFAIE
jgi:hypothetical protein